MRPLSPRQLRAMYASRRQRNIAEPTQQAASTAQVIRDVRGSDQKKKKSNWKRAGVIAGTTAAIGGAAAGLYLGRNLPSQGVKQGVQQLVRRLNNRRAVRTFFAAKKPKLPTNIYHTLLNKKPKLPTNIYHTLLNKKPKLS